MFCRWVNLLGTRTVTTGTAGAGAALPGSVSTGLTPGGDFTIEQFVTIPTLVKDYSSFFAFGAGGGSNFTLDPNFQGSPLAGETVGNFASGNANAGTKGFGGPFPFGAAQHTRSR